MEVPNRKVGASAIAGALTVIGVWLLGMAGIDMPPEVASACTVLLAFGVGYVVPEPEEDE